MGSLWYPDGTEILPEALTRPFDQKALEKMILIWEKEAEEKKQKRESCARKWHPGSKACYKVLVPGPTMHMYCPKCDTHYERGLTQEEWKDYEQAMRTVFY